MARDAFWRLVCHRPLLYLCDDFLTPGECDAVLRMAAPLLPEGEELQQQLSGGRRKRCADLEASDERLSPEDSALLRRLDQRLAALTGVRTHAGELPWAVHVTPPAVQEIDAEAAGAEAEGASNRMALGLHVDTNNERDRRWLTFIAYLRTTPAAAGGHTVFPLATRGSKDGQASSDGDVAERLRAAAERLLGVGLRHTGRPGATQLAWRPEGASGDAEELLGHAGRIASAAARAASGAARREEDEEVGRRGLYWDPSGLGLAVPAEQGACVAFFTRSEASGGRVDPHSWHGGASVRPGAEEADVDGIAKWTLQRFREAPLEAKGGASVEAFARRHGALRPCCGGGVRFDVDAAEVDI